MTLKIFPILALSDFLTLPLITPDFTSCTTGTQKTLHIMVRDIATVISLPAVIFDPLQSM